MLSKYELEHEITNYSQLQQALAQCTTAKNTCGIRQGYSPEMLVTSVWKKRQNSRLTNWR